MKRCRAFAAFCAIVLLVTATGCESLMHNLQPHRLWRLNRVPAPSRNPYFSISDAEAEAAVRSATEVSAEPLTSAAALTGRENDVPGREQ